MLETVNAIDGKAIDTQKDAREIWVDTAKGGAIILVVIGHAWRGIEAAGLLNDVPKGLFAAIDTRIYAFHMPLFFLLSGLFVVAAMSRLTVAKFAANRAWRLFYPLVLWTYIFALAKALAGPLANDPISFREAFVSPIPGKWQFWFLWALLVLQIGLLLLRPALIREHWRLPALWILLLGSFAIQAVQLPLIVDVWTSNALTYLPYLVLGIILTELGTNLLQAERYGPLYIVVFVLVLTAVPFLQKVAISSVLTAAILCLCSVGVSIWWSYHQPGHAEKLAILGRYSMIIFLSHTIFSAGAREAMVAAGIDGIVLHMLIATVAGIAFPIALQNVAAKLMSHRVLGV